MFSPETSAAVVGKMTTKSDESYFNLYHSIITK